MTSLDALRETLRAHADDASPLDPLGAATAPRLAGVRERVRRARRRRAAATAAVAAAVAVGVLGVVTAWPDAAPPAPAARTDQRTTAAALDADGLPPWADPAGRPLQAATSVDAAGPREASLRFTPRADGGVSLLVQCTGARGARVAWFVGDRRGGDVRCGTGRGAAFVAPTARQWAALGAVAGAPARVSLRVVGDGDEPATGAAPPARAVLAVYEADDPAVQGPALRSGTVTARRDGVAGLDRPVDLPYLGEDEFAPLTLLAATDVSAAPGAVRAFRLDPASLDGLVATASCRERGDALAGSRLLVAVAGKAYTDLGCSDESGSSPSSWPRGDAGTTWRGYEVPEGGPVTVAVRVRTAAEVDRAAGPAPAEPAAAVRERVPPLVDLGFYGAPAVHDEPGAREASLAALADPPATLDGLPLLATKDLVAEDTGLSVPVRGTLRHVVVRYECTGRFAVLALSVQRVHAGEGSGVGAECIGESTRSVELNLSGDVAGWRGGSVDVELGLTSTTAGSGSPIAGLSRSAVVRVSVYGR